ncbi:hypothetical protein [Streptomyces anandii]|uniref:hypothetical protein n=1 Tax=Streptomyces anandii TaxID=285454 RepID=UPI0036A51120
MSLALKPLNLGVEWISEPALAFADGLTHIDPKVGIPAAGPWSRDQPNHPAAVTAGFIGTAGSIAKARTWLSRAAEGVDGDNEHHPFCGFQPDGPFASRLRTDGPEAKITAAEIRAVTADRLRKLEGFNQLLDIIDDRLANLPASMPLPRSCSSRCRPRSPGGTGRYTSETVGWRPCGICVPGSRPGRCSGACARSCSSRRRSSRI